MYLRPLLAVVIALLFTLTATGCRQAPPVEDTPDAGAPEFPGGGGGSREDGGASTDAGTEADAGIESDAGTAQCEDPLASAPAECAYIDLMMWLVHCPGEGWSYPREWSDPSNMACPKFYDVGESRCGTLEDVLREEGCDLTCIRRPDKAVSFVHCGVRSDFVTFVDVNGDETACPTMYKFDDGFAASYEQWQADHPCP